MIRSIVSHTQPRKGARVERALRDNPGVHKVFRYSLFRRRLDFYPYLLRQADLRMITDLSILLS